MNENKKAGSGLNSSTLSSIKLKMEKEEKQMLDSGIAAYKKGDSEKAEGIFRQFIKNYPGSDLADNACYNLAKISIAKNDYYRALNWYEQLLEKYPDSDAAYFGKDEYTELCRTLGEKTAEIDSECYYNAKKLLAKKCIDAAEEGFKRLLETYADSEYADNAHYELAKICKMRGDKEGAKRHVEIIMTRYADTDAALYAEELLNE